MMLLTKVFLLLSLVVLEKAGAKFEADEVGWGPQIGGLDQNGGGWGQDGGGWGQNGVGWPKNGGGWGQNGGGWWSPDTKGKQTSRHC